MPIVRSFLRTRYVDEFDEFDGFDAQEHFPIITNTQDAEDSFQTENKSVLNNQIVEKHSKHFWLLWLSRINPFKSTIKMQGN